MKTLKRLSALLLALLLALWCSVGALATDESMQFHFDLTIDGEHTKNVLRGDVITVVFALERTDSAQNYTVYGVQNEIEYDPTFFEFVEGSALLMPGIDKSQVALVDGMHRFYMNFLSLGGGTQWPATTTLGSFQLRVIAETGVTHIRNKANFVSTRDGVDHYASTKDDVTVILSGECIIRFDPNGGSQVDEIRVPYGEKIPRPDDPTREGKYFAGWFTDIERTHPWDFDNDTVEGNMTLYAGWSDAPLDTDASEKTGGHLLAWLLPLLGLIGLLLILLLLLRKRVQFVTFGGTELDDVRVWRGAKIEMPATPLKTGSLFGGWFKDEECTQPWDVDEDTVDKNMTLYARWN